MTFINSTSNVLVTGGCGFLGSNFILFLLGRNDFHGKIINVDKLSYAANLNNLEDASNNPRYCFYQINIQDFASIEKICLEHKINLIVHFAAETHVDNSIEDPILFVRANVFGTVSLLEIVRKYPYIHLHHISTDEVYGDLSLVGSFSELSAYRPSSPYAASKASSDHFVRAYLKTYQISATISNSCNNFGPRQHKEKMIPKMIENLYEKKKLPIYGEGKNHREWIFVDDHSRALLSILKYGKKGESYNIGSNFEISNFELVKLIINRYCKITNEQVEKCLLLIQFVKDRLGHDFRYFLNCTKLQKLGFVSKHSINEGLDTTIRYILKKKNAPAVNLKN